MASRRAKARSDGALHGWCTFRDGDDDIECIAPAETDARTKVDGDDFNVDYVFPPELARPLVWSSAAPAIPITISLGRAADDARAVTFSILGCILIATSVVHWRSPRWSSARRGVDYSAVLACLAYGTYLSTTVPSRFGQIWWYGMSFVAIMFVFNESAFYLELRNVPNVPEAVDAKAFWTRRRVYERTVRVHFFCVHLVSSLVASFVAYGIGAPMK
jgi:hypothetical protein